MGSLNRGVGPFSPANPDAPYFQIKIQETIYDIDINFIESLTVDRQTDQAGELHFTIYDRSDPVRDDSSGLEYKFNQIIAYYGDQYLLSFQYGWNHGPKSPWYSGNIMDYTPTYLPGGYIKMDVKVLLVTKEFDSVEQVKAYTGMSSSDIVAQICEDMGWVIEDLEPSKPYAVPKTFEVSNVDVISFIREEIEPKTVNIKNEPFRFYIEPINGQNHVYFVSVNKSISVQKNYNFYVNMGNYGSVLSWSPSYTGKQVSNRVVEMPVFDTDTNDMTVYKAGDRKPVDGGPSLTAYGATDPDLMEAMIANKWFNENVGTIKATMEIVGDPTIKPQQKINVMAMNPNGSSHISSGTYLVTHITDTISGDFRSSLELIQEGVEGGNGLETMPMSEIVELKGSV